ncbi:hypothetical protein [Trichloromonas sp.]|jgi:hypothetical protein|uniref:hypothetical protein n=1 Tax=Trichloromonas sp. TaxID=3069249 RepID=UPI002A453034|nr:hypothetical protein [Trichloromonas sp.]
MLLLQIDPSVIDSIDSIYKLSALIIITLAYVFTIIYNKRNDRKKIKEIVNSFEEQNNKIIDKIEQLREHKNILDDQSSINMISLTLKTSLVDVTNSVNDIIDNILFNNEKTMFIPKKSLIYEKIVEIVNTNFDNDIIILNKIYHNNIKLSHFISEYNRDELIQDIVNKLLTTSDISKKNDIIKYIQNKYLQIIQSIQLKLTK